MPRNARPESEAFKQYDAMTTEELQQILRDDASKPEGAESNMEMLLYVMDVLAKRRQANHEGKTPEEALETFKQEYYTEIDISSDSESASAPNRSYRRTRWMTGLIAAAAALVFIIGSSFTANAIGFDVWGIIAKWTQETFHFGSSEQTGESNVPSPDFVCPCTSLQDALSMRDITTALVPTWLPDGYIEGDVEITQTPKHRSFAAKYQGDSSTIRIRIADYLDSHPTQIERSDSLVEVYTNAGIAYYIFDNEGVLQAVWVTESFECCISGPVTLSEMKDIINSIEKG